MIEQSETVNKRGGRDRKVQDTSLLDSSVHAVSILLECDVEHYSDFDCSVACVGEKKEDASECKKKGSDMMILTEVSEDFEEEKSVEIEVTCECESANRQRNKELEAENSYLSNKCQELLGKLSNLTDMVEKLNGKLIDEKMRSSMWNDQRIDLENELNYFREKETIVDDISGKKRTSPLKNDSLNQKEFAEDSLKSGVEEVQTRVSIDEDLQGKLIGLTGMNSYEIEALKQEKDQCMKVIAQLKEDLAEMRKEKELVFDNFAKVSEENKTLRAEVYTLQKDLVSSGNTKMETVERLDSPASKQIAVKQRFRTVQEPIAHTNKEDEKVSDIFQKIEYQAKGRVLTESFAGFDGSKDTSNANQSTMISNSQLESSLQNAGRSLKDSQQQFPIPLKSISNSTHLHREDHMAQAAKARHNKLRNMTSNVFQMNEEASDLKSRSFTPNPKQVKEQDNTDPSTPPPKEKPEVVEPYHTRDRKCSRRNPTNLESQPTHLMSNEKPNETALIPMDKNAVSDLLVLANKEKDEVS